MSEEKRSEAVEGDKSSTAEPQDRSAQRGNSSSRARNQTVMLSPELTGQVRSMLNKGEGQQNPDPLSELLPPLGWDRPQQPSVVPSSGSSSASHPSARHSSGGDYGSNLSHESDLSAGSKKPTGKLRSGSNPTPESTAGSSSSHPSFTLNPNVARSTPSHAGQTMVANVHRAPERSPKSRIVGFFISFDKIENGEVFEIRVGRWLLTSRTTDHGDNILIDDESVSPLHAIVRATSEGKVQVLDQLSEFGTGVTRVGSSQEDEVAGAMVNLSHGDRVRFGKRHFVVCIVPKVEKDSAADTASTTN